MFIFLVTHVNRENVTQAHFHTCKKKIYMYTYRRQIKDTHTSMRYKVLLGFVLGMSIS